MSSALAPADAQKEHAAGAFLDALQSAGPLAHRMRQVLYSSPASVALILATLLSACAAAGSVVPSRSLGTPAADASREPSGPAASVSAAPTTAPKPTEPSGIGQVVADEPLVLRSHPGTGSESAILDVRLHPGMRFRILEGPTAASGYQWYRVRVGAQEGWAAAGTRRGDPYEPWLARVENGPIAVARGESDTGPALPQVHLVEPDGTELGQITSLSGQDLVVRSVRRGNVLALTCGTAVHALAWSRDGSRLAFAVGSCDSAIYLVDADGGAQRRVGEGRTFAWSPDGGRLSFSLNSPFLPQGCAGGSWELQVLALATEDGRPAAVTDSDPCVATAAPDWSPDGRSIAFTAGPLGADSDGQAVWQVDPVSHDEVSLAAGYGPRWSPDGSTLLVHRIVDGNGEDPGCFTCLGAIWAVAADGSAERRIGSGYDAGWSPDGDRVAFWRGSDRAEVVVANADGSDPRVLDLQGRFAGWSPDGRQVLITDEHGLWRYTLDGRPPVSLGSAAPDGAAAWQPVLEPLPPAE